ncbi:MAG: glycoside hydrolase family 16 protein [Methylobacterium sp.]
MRDPSAERPQRIVGAGRAGGRLAVLLGLAAFGTASLAAQETAPIDLSRYEPTFVEEFDTLDVSARGPGTRWIAHTPWNGDFGDAAFTDPRPGFPFTTENGHLRIEMRKGSDGKWRSGLLASVDPEMKGFSQRYGYFEMSAKFPPGEGVWPGFWLMGVERDKTASEIDIVEYYGKASDRYFATLHVWDRVNKPAQNKAQFERIFVPPGSLSAGFHTYGVDIEEQTTTFYHDRKPVWSQPTRPEHRQPMYVLLNLAAGAGWPIAAMPNPSVMEVDYVRAWQRKAP